MTDSPVSVNVTAGASAGVPAADGSASPFRVFEHVVDGVTHMVVDSWEFHEALGASESKHRRWIRARLA